MPRMLPIHMLLLVNNLYWLQNALRDSSKQSLKAKLTSVNMSKCKRIENVIKSHLNVAIAVKKSQFIN